MKTLCLEDGELSLVKQLTQTAKSHKLLCRIISQLTAPLHSQLRRFTFFILLIWKFHISRHYPQNLLHLLKNWFHKWLMKRVHLNGRVPYYSNFFSPQFLLWRNGRHIEGETILILLIFITVYISYAAVHNMSWHVYSEAVKLAVYLCSFWIEMSCFVL